MLLENRTALAQADAREVKHRGTNRAKEATLAGLELGLYLPGEVKGLKDQLMNARAVRPSSSSDFPLLASVRDRG